MDFTPQTLSEEFLRQLKFKCPDVLLVLQEGADPVITIAAAHADVGDIVIWFDNEEITVGIGEYYHCHFDLFRYEPEKDRVKDPEEIGDAVNWIRSFLDGQVILEICKVDGQYSGGSTYPTSHLKPARIPSNAELFTWNGPWDGRDVGNAS